MPDLPTPAFDPTAAGVVEILRVWTTSAGERVVLRVDTLEPAAWGILLVDIGKHVAHAYARAGTHSANDAFAQLLATFIAEIGNATDSPSEAR
ncbi:MAG TPA: DUF5076 domain-containing protein [Marisediminicola sp.]|jgi:hypothetical protein|nr:DUF5076 domain-containing protein [Marisediminicola sp.]